jgi:2,3-bisphosphoglycerate-dependent phosphoglycerate mutase
VAKLYIVRHALVNVDFSIPSSEWEISEVGINETRDLVLGESWNEVRRIYHSPERKAVATARIISEMTDIPLASMDDLHELHIPTINPAEEFIRRVGAYLGGFPDPEFEDWDEATTRIVGCVQNIISEANGSSVAMVSHGRILTVLFSHLMKRRMTVTEWQSIRLPDLSVIDLDTWTVERGFFSNLW